MKKLRMFLGWMVALVLLTACSEDISGTWYYEGNTEDKQLSLTVEDKEVTVDYRYIEMKPSLFSIDFEEGSGTLASGEVKGNTVVLSASSDSNNPFPGIVDEEAEEFTVELSSKKDAMTLKKSNGKKISFLKEDPKELNLERRTYLDDESDTNSSDAASSSGTTDFSIDPSVVTDSETNEMYKAPSTLTKYVGTYSGDLGEDSSHFTEGAFRAQLKINADGTFTQLLAEYSDSKEATVVSHYGYFDESENFHEATGSLIQIAGKEYDRLTQVTYTRGVVVEKFGKLYLAEMQRIVQDGSDSYFDTDGTLNYAKTIFVEDTWMRANSTSTLPTTEDFASYYQSKLANLVDSYTLSGDQLSDYGTIEGDDIKVNGIIMQKSADVDFLVKETLSDVAKKIFSADEMSSTNALFQLQEFTIDNMKDIRRMSSEDLSNLYTADGKQVTSIDSGYRYNRDSFMDTSGVTVEVVIDGKLYDGTESDGRFVLRAN